MDTRAKTNEPAIAANGFSEDNSVEVISDEEAREVFDLRAHQLLGISGEEFLKRYDRGDYHGQPEENPAVITLEILLPLVRRV